MRKMFAPNQSSADASRSVEERAERYVRRLQGFYAHLAAYLSLNAGLVLINLLASPEVFWAIWPILGWGVKVAAHALAVFGVPGLAAWKARVRRNYIRRHADRPAESVGEPGVGTSSEKGGDEAERLRRRVEHLEAIVTSADWDLLADLDDTETPDERAAALADEVVPR